MRLLRRLAYAGLALAFSRVVLGAVARATGATSAARGTSPLADAIGDDAVRTSIVGAAAAVADRALAVGTGAALLSLLGAALLRRRVPGVGGRGGVLRAAALATAVGAASVALDATSVAEPLWLAVALRLALVGAIAVAAMRAGGLGAGEEDDSAAASPIALRPRGRSIAAATLAALLAPVAVLLGPPAMGWASLGTTSLLMILVAVVIGALAPRDGWNATEAARAAYIALGTLVLQALVGGGLAALALPGAARTMHEALGAIVWLALVVTATLVRHAQVRPAPAPTRVIATPAAIAFDEHAPAPTVAPVATAAAAAATPLEITSADAPTVDPSAATSTAPAVESTANVESTASIGATDDAVVAAETVSAVETVFDSTLPVEPLAPPVQPLTLAEPPDATVVADRDEDVVDDFRFPAFPLPSRAVAADPVAAAVVEAEPAHANAPPAGDVAEEIVAAPAEPGHSVVAESVDVPAGASEVATWTDFVVERVAADEPVALDDVPARQAEEPVVAIVETPPLDEAVGDALADSLADTVTDDAAVEESYVEGTRDEAAPYSKEPFAEPTVAVAAAVDDIDEASVEGDVSVEATMVSPSSNTSLADVALDDNGGAAAAPAPTVDVSPGADLVAAEAIASEAIAMETTATDADDVRTLGAEATALEAVAADAIAEDATLEDATLEDATFEEATFEEATFEEATLEDATLEDATLEDASEPASIVALAPVDESWVEGPPATSLDAVEALVDDQPVEAAPAAVAPLTPDPAASVVEEEDEPEREEPFTGAAELMDVPDYEPESSVAALDVADVDETEVDELVIDGPLPAAFFERELERELARELDRARAHEEERERQRPRIAEEPRSREPARESAPEPALASDAAAADAMVGDALVGDALASDAAVGDTAAADTPLGDGVAGDGTEPTITPLPRRPRRPPTLAVLLARGADF